MPVLSLIAQVAQRGWFIHAYTAQKKPHSLVHTILHGLQEARGEGGVCVCAVQECWEWGREARSHILDGLSVQGWGGWVDNVIRAESKRKRRGTNVIKTVVSISTLGPSFKKQTQHPVTGNHPRSLQKTEAESGCKTDRTQAGSFPSV